MGMALERDTFGAKRINGFTSGVAMGAIWGTKSVRFRVLGAELMTVARLGLTAGAKNGFPLLAALGTFNVGADLLTKSVNGAAAGGMVKDERVLLALATAGAKKGPTAGASPSAGARTGDANTAGAIVERVDNGGNGGLFEPPRSTGLNDGVALCFGAEVGEEKAICRKMVRMSNTCFIF